MKRNLLSLFFVFLFIQSIAQDFRGVSPAGLSGYVPSSFVFATSVDGWGTPDMWNPANAVTGTMVWVDDGTGGDSLGCNALINGSAVNGKIAVVYRGACSFAQKAQNAQNAGAIAVIIIDYGSVVTQLSGGSPSVTIPIVMISPDGGYLRSFIDNGDGVVFLGADCSSFATIQVPPPNNIIDASCDGVCDGQFNTSFNASFSYYFDLYDTGNNFLSSQGPFTGSQTVTFNGLCAGDYYVKVRVDIPNCTAEGTGSLATIGNAGVINGFNGIVSDASTCTNNDGQIQVSFIGNGAFANPNISWTGLSTGSSNSISSPYTISNLLPGNYTISFTSNTNSSCTAINQSVQVGTSLLNQEVCTVTVDSASASYNVIIWEKPIGVLGIDSFYVYREVSTNIYEKIGAVAFEDSSVFEDITANPNQQSWKYKLSILDDCGNEGDLGNYHQSIHLQYGSNGNFNWNHYVIENTSNPVLNYVFLKDDLNNGNWATIGTPVSNSFTDLNYASTPNAAYRVYVNWNISCSPSRVGVNTSRSNIKNASATNDIDEKVLDSFIQIYPNPTTSFIQIISSGLPFSEINILDASGRLIRNESINSYFFELNIEDLESGIYFIEIHSSLGKTIRKITKQ